MKTIVRIFCSFMIVAAIIFSQAACGTKQLDTATKASGTIAKYTGTVIDTVDNLWTTGVINDIKVKDFIAQKLKDFSISGNNFNNLLISYSKQYGTGDVPANVWKDIITHFDEISKLFLDLLQQIPSLAGLQNSQAFRFISAAVVTLANLFLSVGGIDKLMLKTLMPNYGEVAGRMKQIKVLIPNWQQLMPAYYAEAV